MNPDTHAIPKGIRSVCTTQIWLTLDVQLSFVSGSGCICPEVQDFQRILFYPKVAKCSNGGLFRYHLPQQERQAANGPTDYRTGDYRENRANQRLHKNGDL